VSDPYLEEDYAEPAGEELEPAQEPATLDAETLEQMVDWAVEERLGREAGIDEFQADYEQRQAAEDAAAAQEEREAQLDDAAEHELILRVTRAAEQAGITDPRIAVDALEAANGLAEDPNFQRQHPGNELVEAAIAEGFRLVLPSDGEDEIAAAERIMSRRAAHARMVNLRAGIPDRGAEERLFAAVAETVGATRGEIKEARKMLQLPGEP
jgi:hypothetical protein